MFTHTSHVMTLANSIIGVGILAMPFCFQKCGIVLAIVLLVISSWITRICCHYLIKCSLLTRRRSFEFLGLHAFGASGKLLAELCIIGYLVGTCITYFVVVGDLGPQIVEKMFSLEAGQKHLRTVVMFALTILCIVPLGMLKNVNSLSALCTASIGFYVCLVLKIVFESESHIVLNDWPAKVRYWEPAGVLQCLPIFSMALSCQMQIFEVFGSINNQSLEKLNSIVRNATWMCTFVYIAVGFFGYVAFCTQSFAGNILMNLSPTFSSDIIKIGFVLSIAFSFPLVIFPCRASIYSLLYRKGLTDASSYIPETRFRAITLFIVCFSLCIALMIPSVELIIGLVGSTIGVAICIMFPASSFRKIIKKDSTERMLAQLIFVGGFCLMILGTYANLSAIEQQSSATHVDVLQGIEQNLIQPPTPLSLSNRVAEIEASLQKAKLRQEEQDRIKIQAVHVATNASNKRKKGDKVKPAAANSEKQAMPPLPIDEHHDTIVKKTQPIEEAIENAEKSQPAAVAKEAVPDAEAPSPKQTMSDAGQHMPPLPVAEVHERVGENSELQKPEKTIMKDNNKTLEKSVDTKHVAAVEPLILVVDKSALNQTTQQAAIDKAAIKKEEDVVAEEQKESKDKDEELRETQNELKKAKELLERKVDELKVELAKQNEETQQYVAEKLSEVVDKVEQIERKVQNTKQAPKPPAPNAFNPPVNAAQPPAATDERGIQQKGSLLGMLAESVHTREEQEAHAGVYEPLSYKTGEKINDNKNKNHKAKDESWPKLANAKLPLPLALLRNASLIKMGTEPVNETLQRDNVEAIRRDILQLKTAPTADDAAASTASAHLRVRRDLETVADLHEKCLQKKHKLAEVDLHAAGIAALQVANMGRELKSVREDEDTQTQAVKL